MFQIQRYHSPLPCDVVQRQPYPGLVQPDLPHDVVEQRHDRHPPLRIPVLQLGEDGGGEERGALLAGLGADGAELFVANHLEKTTKLKKCFFAAIGKPLSEEKN